MRRVSHLLFLVALLIFQWAGCVLAQEYNEEDVLIKQKTFPLYQKAIRAFENEDYHGCVELCREALNYDHGDKELYHLQALALAESGEMDEALASFRSGLALDYNFIQCRNNMGIVQMKLGRLDEASMTFHECIKLKPDYPDAHYHLGEIMQKKGDLDAAIEEYETATRLNPNYFEAQRDLGLAIYERASSGLNDIADSEEKLKIAAKLAPTNPMIHYHLGNIYCSGGKLDEAESEFRAALSFDSRLAAAHYELGRLRYLRGDVERCLVEMNLASKVSPTYTDGKKYPTVDISKIKSMMAKCYEIKENFKQAISFWDDLASMTKNNKDILKHINKLAKTKPTRHKKPDCQDNIAQSIIIKGITQADSDQFDAAKATFEIVERDYPDCFEGWQYHGALQEITSNLQAAMADYKKAMELAPDYDGLYFNMAYLLEKMGLPADAGAMYEKFHTIAGKYPYDSKHIVSLEQEYARQQAKIH